MKNSKQTIMERYRAPNYPPPQPQRQIYRQKEYIQLEPIPRCLINIYRWEDNEAV